MPTKALLKLCVVVLLDMFVAIGIAFATLPFYLQSFGGSASSMGIAIMLFSGMQFLLIPFWGALSDRFGRRPLLMLQQLGAALGMAMLAFAPSVEWVFAGRAVGGIFGGTFMLSTAYVSDITPAVKRTKAVGALAVSLILGGFMLGPAIGGVLSRVGLALPFAVAAGVALVNCAYIFFVIEEPHTHREQSPKMSKESFRLATESSRTRGAVALNLVTFGGVAALQTCLVFFMGARFHLTADRVGPLFGILGVTGIVMQGGVVGWLSAKFGEPRIVMTSALLNCVALLLIAASPVFGLVVAAFIAYGFCQGMLLPSLMSLASIGAPPALRGTVMGLFFAGQSLVLVFAPPLHGWLYDHVAVSAPFYLASALFGTVAIAAYFWNWGPQIEFEPRP